MPENALTCTLHDRHSVSKHMGSRIPKDPLSEMGIPAQSETKELM